MKLSELPIYPDDDNNVVESYIKEVRQVQTEEDLEIFVKRWRTLWEDDTDSKLYDETYNASETLNCLKILRGGGECEHVGTTKSCDGINLVLPSPFLKATVVSKKYGVPISIALIQSFGGY